MFDTAGKQYLIIGGTTKAATTSLYYYLADHPDVCASSMKETRFFIDEDYPVPPSNAEGWATSVDKFEELYFKGATEQYLLEATPDYLYSIGTPERIREMLPSAKVIFLLRDPITRMVSWYKYARQKANIPKSITFEEYIEKQLRHKYFEAAKQHRIEVVRAAESKEEDINSTDPPRSYFFCALEHGRYTTYLQRYLHVLGPERVRVYCYEDLVADPQQIMIDLCNFVSLSSDFYDNYEFKVFNRSRAMRSAQLDKVYSRLRSMIRKRTHNLFIHKGLKQLRIWTDPIYYWLNSQTTKGIKIPADTRKRLVDYYRADVQHLENMLGRSLPWSIHSMKKVEEG